MNILPYETLCRLALEGADYHWRDTPIEVTPMARHSDPFKHAGRLPDPWWTKAEPRDASGREVILIHTRDDKPNSERNMVRQTNDEFEPNETESIADWFGRIAKSHDFNSNTYRKFLFDAMRAYASRFRGDGSAKKLLDAKLVRKFIEQVA